jgi:membrane associated rhomboid family serine protease
MSTIWQELKFKIQHSNSRLPLLIGINVAVFLLINIPAVIEWLTSPTAYIRTISDDYLALPAHLPKLIARVWTPITYMFMHAGVFHILFNMLWLYWMGQIFEEYLGYKRTVMLYLLGGLGGALVFVAAYNLLPTLAANNVGATVVGASASVMAVIIATATLLPNYTIYLFLLGPVKLKWLALAYIVIDFLSIAGPNAGGEIAHLGGALFGFIYIKQLQRGNDWSKPVTNLFTPKPKVKVVSRNDYVSHKNTASYPDQDEIDRILDKISHSGYDSLNKQEKETLFRASDNK